jgi:hypothetical protein
LATVRVVSLKDRVFKPIDAEMLIDLEAFDGLTGRQKKALLDHELAHLELKEFTYFPVLDSDGQPTGETEIRFEKDDLDRPKLRLRKGDANFGDAFATVIQRNGRAAVEFLNAKKFNEFADRALADGGVK